MSKLSLWKKAVYQIPRAGAMRVPGLVVLNDKLLADAEIERCLQQVENVATLEGIIGYSVAMPDMHWGYGFPIGGVAAMDAKTGVISPGGVGYDINCGVRLALASLHYKDISKKQLSTLLENIFKRVPSGMGRGHQGKKKLLAADYEKLLVQGARWSIEQGCGLSADVEFTESRGCLELADPGQVSQNAKERGQDQLGTIGSGNHFIEIGRVETLLDETTCAAWNISQGQIYILIHCGSRGLGHQVCQDTLDLFLRSNLQKNLIDPQLVCAPIASSYGQNYLQAMAAAANFAFNNRQQILHQVRLAFQEVLNIAPSQIPLLYDVCHNIAKMEEHLVEGKLHTVCVHRKGATRAFGPGHPELCTLYQTTGQPVLIPGDMQRASYIMKGLNNPLTGSNFAWCSACHGAGRALSRIKSLEKWRHKDPIHAMQQHGIAVRASSNRTVAEEMPDAYKNVSDVVAAVEEAGLASSVAKLCPLMVIKG